MAAEDPAAEEGAGGGACSPEQRERLKGLVDGERRWGPAPPARLGWTAYEMPILRALAARGGRARRRDAMAAVEAEMAERFAAGDREIARGKPRWQAELDIARRRLFEHGFLARGAREGIWELTSAGVERVGCASDGLEPRAQKETSSDGAGSTRPQSVGVA